MSSSNLGASPEDFIPTTPALFVAKMQQFITSGWDIQVQIQFPMSEAQSYIRYMSVTSIQDAQNGYECIIKNYGVTLIPHGAKFLIFAP